MMTRMTTTMMPTTSKKKNNDNDNDDDDDNDNEDDDDNDDDEDDDNKDEDEEEEIEVANLMLNSRDIVTVVPMIKMSKKMWIAHMAASMHITNEEQGLYDVKNIKESIKIGSGENVYATKVGKLDVSFVQEKGRRVAFMLKNICYIPSFYVKVFSLTVTMSKGCKIISKNLVIIVRKGMLKLRFDARQNKRDEFVCGLNLDIRATKMSMNKCLDTKEMAKDSTNDKTDSVYKERHKNKMKTE